MPSITVAQAAEQLAAGQLVAMPTETVYGLAADATQGEALAQVFTLKGRPRFNPLIVHVRDAGAAARLVHWTPLAARLADQFWPGPLTLVLEQLDGGPVHPLASGGLKTLALRAPRHPLARSLLNHFPAGLAAPSANPSGRLSPTRPEHVQAGFDADAPPILDGGPCALGLESTIVDARADLPRLLREGAIPREALQPLAPEAQSSGIESPGQLLRHYAPKARLRLNATQVEAGETLLAFGPPLSHAGEALQLSAGAELQEAAANLFAALHALDKLGAQRVAVMPIPNEGLGRAINDRLQRGSA